MLQPRRLKYRKPQRRKVKGKATRGNKVAFGDFGLQSLDHGWISAHQIEAGRVAARHGLKGSSGKIWIRIFPHKPITATPQETRMGKGKGSPIDYVAVVKPGTVMFEIGGVSEDVAREALNRVAHKLPVRCKMIRKEMV